MTLSKGKNQGTVVKMTALAIVLAFAVSAFGPLTAVGSNAIPTPNAIGTQPRESFTAEPSLMASAPEPVEPNTILIQPNATVGKDTFMVDFDQSDNNFGVFNQIQVGTDGLYQVRGAVQFSVPPTIATIKTATLSLYCFDVISTPYGVNISMEPLLDVWSEGDGTKYLNTTWTNRTTGVPWAIPGGRSNSAISSYINVSAENVWYNWNVTQIVKSWAAGTYANNGFLINWSAISPANTWAAFRSSDYLVDTTLHPKLTITYAAEIIDPVPAQAFAEDEAARAISLSGRGNGTVEHTSGPVDSSRGMPFYGASMTMGQIHYLYNASQVGAEGKIMRLSFERVSAMNVGTFNNFRIQMAHTDLAELTTTFSANYHGFPIEVFPTQTLFVNSSNKDLAINLDLNGNFTYDSQYNLLINITWSSGTDDIATRSTEGAPGAVNTRLSTAVAGNTGALDDTLPVLRFYVDVMDNAVFDNGTTPNTNMFNTLRTYTKFQMLYNATDLGKQPGIINKIGFYKGLSTNSVFPHLNISIAYTDNNTNTTSASLSSNFTHNYIGSLTNVFYEASYRFTNESGWFDFDINNFAYDGSRNLLIQIDWSGTATGTSVAFNRGAAAALPANNWTYTYTAGAFTGVQDSRFYIMQLIFADSANLTWSASSSAPTMFTAGVSGRTLTITPLPNQFGTGTVTLYLSNSNGDFVTQDIPVTITAVNDVPILAALANLLCVEDEPKALNISTSITDIDDLIGDIKVTTTSNYDTINGTVITFTYPEGVTGETITVTVTDKAGLSATQQLVTTVTMVNDKPLFTGFVSNITCDATLPEQVTLIPMDEETSAGHLKIYTNSQYANLSGHTLHLLYPKGIGFELITINLVDNLTYGVLNNVSFLLNVTIIDHPEVTTYLPTGVAIPVTTTVQTTFDMPMNKTKAQNAFSMKLGTTAVVGNFTWNTNKTVMTFTPSSHLTNGLYVVRIAASAESTDGIRMLNAFEWNFTAELGSFDGDGDGMTDQWEMDNDLDPNVDDAQNDSDGDSMPNIYEFENDLDPQLNDALSDADNDGMPNIYEFENDLDPQVNDADADSDNDGATNFEEYEAGTDPSDPDSKPSEFTWIIWVIILIAIIAVVAIVLLLMTRKPKSVQLQQAYEQGQEDAELDREDAQEGNQPEGWETEPAQEGQPPQQDGQPPQPGTP